MVDHTIVVSSGLDLLASVVCSESPNKAESGTITSETEGCESLISPVLQKVLIYPRAQSSNKAPRKRFLQEIPDNLTSPDALRKMALKEFEKISLLLIKRIMLKTSMLNYFIKRVLQLAQREAEKSQLNLKSNKNCSKHCPV